MMGECTDHKRLRRRSQSRNLWEGTSRRLGSFVLRWRLKAATDALGKDRDRNHRTNEAQHNLQATAGSQRHFSLVTVSLWAQSQLQQSRHLANAGLIDGLWLRIGRGPLSYATPIEAVPMGSGQGGIVEHAPLSNCLSYLFDGTFAFRI
jgi:hypothetical protein